MSALVVEVDRRKTYVDEEGRRLVLAERFPPVPFRPQIEADGWIQSIETAPASSRAVLSRVEQTIVLKLPDEAPGLDACLMWGTAYGFREPAIVFHLEGVHVVVAPFQVDGPSIDLTWWKDDEASGVVFLRIYSGLATTASWQGVPSALLAQEKEADAQGAFGDRHRPIDVLWCLDRIRAPLVSYRKREALRVFPYLRPLDDLPTKATDETRTLLELIRLCRHVLEGRSASVAGLSELVNPTKLDPYQPVEQVAAWAEKRGIDEPIAFFVRTVAPLLTAKAFPKTVMYALAKSMREELVASISFDGEEKGS